METAIVYRNGPVKVGEHSGDLRKLWSIYDSVKPAGRAGRLDGIYASPTLTGMARWTHTNHVNGIVTSAMDMANYAITVRNPERIFLYDVNEYDNTAFLLTLYTENEASTWNTENQELAKEYWDSGISLLEWEKKAKEEFLDPFEWEALVPADCIVSYSAVPDEEVIEATPLEAQEKVRSALANYKEWKESVQRGESPAPIEKPNPMDTRWTCLGRVE